MTQAPPRTRLLLGALSVALLAAVTACTPTAGPTPGGPSATPSATTSEEQSQPVAIIPGTRPDEQLLAVVIQRHLRNQGIPAEVGEPSAEPWGAAGEHQVAVVDTLAMATQLVPEALVGEGPTAAASPGASGSGSPDGSPTGSPSATPSDPAPASPTGHPTATGSPTPLPEGRPAADAQGTTAMVTEHLPEDTEVLGASTGTMRLTAVATTALTGLYDLQSLSDLNGLCDRLAVGPASAEAVYAERLDALAGCVPAEWVEAGVGPGPQGVVTDLVTGRADVVLLYGTDPAIPDQALEALDDPARVLPEGRFLLVGDPEGLPDGTGGALEAVAGKLGDEMLTELGRLSRGPDQLTREEAAQFWLVAAGLEDRPDGWF